MYTLKSIARRGSMLGAATAVLVATALPSSLAFADALNPLTKRSLTLSSSSPGWSYTDGSGNATYAQPNSGANGKQTGNTFTFNTSSDATIKGFTFQYCTHSAGVCTAPGNDTYAGTSGSYTRNGDDVANFQSDLNVVSSSPSETTASGIVNLSSTDAAVTAVPNPNGSQGNYIVLYKNSGDANWSQSTGWTMTAAPYEDTNSVSAGSATGKNNFITLKNTGGASLHSDAQVKIIFFGTTSNYITNPGAGAFFVKINDYNDDGTAGTLNAGATSLVDGGVTVANVMNQSIQIQTKVLETMDFSVGTVDPDTLTSSELQASSLSSSTHGQCDPILTGMTTDVNHGNTLALGDQTAESSLSTNKTYSTHSYFRLSSNSSAGATIYYAGNTLSNTEGDKIAPVGTTAKIPSRGSPQFGLALANGTEAGNGTGGSGPGYNGDTTADGKYSVNYGTEETSGKVYENGADNGKTGVDASMTSDVTSQAYTDYHDPQLYPLIPATGYDQGAGVVNGGADYGAGGTGPTTTKFAFDPNANTIPAAIASENNQVVDCVTGKVRYIGNIAATTPAGIYTTKVNYIAAPQY